MICPRCGKESPSTARFCAYCGSVPAVDVPPVPAPGRRSRLPLAILALALVLAGSVLAFAAIRSRRGAMGGLTSQFAGRPAAGVVTPGGVPGSPATLLPPGVTAADAAGAAAGQGVQAGAPGGAPAPNVTGAMPGGSPAGSSVTAGQPGGFGAGGPVTATPPGGFPDGNRVTAAGPGGMAPGPPVTAAAPGSPPAGTPVTATPPGGVSGSPVTATGPGAVPAGPPVTGTPPGGQPAPALPAEPAPPAAPRGPTQQEIDLVREYLRRLAVVQARDNRLNEVIGEMAGGSMMPWAQTLDGMEDIDQFFGQYTKVMQGYGRVVAAKQTLANDFARACEPIARICPPVQPLHRWYDRYFREWIQATRTLEGALRQHDLGMAMQLQGLVQRAENTERQAQREEDRLRDRYDIPPDPSGPR